MWTPSRCRSTCLAREGCRLKPLYAEGQLEVCEKEATYKETDASFWGIVGFVFMKEDLTKIRDILSANKVLVDTHSGYHMCEVHCPSPEHRPRG